MTAIGILIAIEKVNQIHPETLLLVQVLMVGTFLVVGLSYFYRFICLSFVCIASSFAMNCLTLYLFCILFQVRILVSLFYIGGFLYVASLWP